MGYEVSRRGKKGGWRIRVRQYVKDREIWSSVKVSQYNNLGVRKDMTLEEVRGILQSRNAQENLIALDRKRASIQGRLDAEKQIDCAHLPPLFVVKFETEHLATRYMGNEDRLRKVLKLWTAGQRIIRTVTIPTEKWHRYPEHFYSYFEKGALSLGYCRNILTTINAWLDFLGMEQDRHYRPIPMPSDLWQARINDAFEEADGGLASLPITPGQLEAAQQKHPFKLEQYNWLYCSVWAGLRPNEVTSLTNKKRTQVIYEGQTPVLRVYQSKLKNVPKREHRWKLIPLFLPEQQKILEILQSGAIEEPLAKTVSSRFGEGHTLYAGRKGFHDLMVTRYKQPELEVVRWLGHRSLDMAMKHYARKESVRWTPLEADKKAS